MSCKLPCQLSCNLARKENLIKNTFLNFSHFSPIFIFVTFPLFSYNCHCFLHSFHFFFYQYFKHLFCDSFNATLVLKYCNKFIVLIGSSLYFSIFEIAQLGNLSFSTNFYLKYFISASGDRLVDLTSWNGDWFLDELYSTCGNIAQYIQLLLDSCVVNIFTSLII